MILGDDTECNVRRLCFKAQNPVRKDLLDAMGVADLGITCGAVCVYPSRISDAVKALKDARSSLPVASVAAGFPAGEFYFVHKCGNLEAQGGMHDMFVPSSIFQ